MPITKKLKTAELDGTHSIKKRMLRRLEDTAHHHLGLARVAHMFDLIVDYPESRPALDDLRACVRRTKTELHGVLATSLRASLCERLLHPGAATSDIIRQYVATVKVTRCVARNKTDMTCLDMT